MSRALLVLAVAVVAAGCETEGTSQEDFTAKADAICVAANREKSDLGSLPKGPTEADWWSDFAKVGRAALKDLRALSRPPADEDAIDGMLSRFEQAFASVANYAAARRAGDLEQVLEAYRKSETARREAGLTATGLGIFECEELPSVPD